MASPAFEKLAPLVEKIGSSVASHDLAVTHMRQHGLRHLVRRIRSLSEPGAAGSETVRPRRKPSIIRDMMISLMTVLRE